MSTLPQIIEPVISGTYIISSQKKRYLEARLGTSFGVAIWDKSAHVGGLYHILLPEPVSDGFSYEPERYASTGLPIFLNSLKAAGANIENMEAMVAGGALVGPIQSNDLELNLGGRISEIAIDFLRSENIPVTGSETGGYFSSMLRLNLQTFNCQILPIGYGVGQSNSKVVPLTEEDISTAISRVRPIPQIALKIVKMILLNNYSMKDISREIKKDQIITAKVLKLCNSAYFGLKFKIESIDQALTMLGEKTILQLVVSTSMELYYQDREHGYSLCKGGLYHHALSTAIVSEQLAGYTGKVKPDIAYTAGLLHDIGKVVLDQKVAESSPLFYRRLYPDEVSLIDVEMEVLGTDHTLTGERLATLWSLPGPIHEAIALHHTPDKSELNPELTYTVYLADLLISRFQVGNEAERLDTDNLPRCLEVLGIDNSEFNRVVDIIPWSKLSYSKGIDNNLF